MSQTLNPSRIGYARNNSPTKRLVGLEHRIKYAAQPEKLLFYGKELTRIPN